MSNITMKSTKQEIMEAYEKAKAELDAMNNMKDDPKEKAEQKRVETVIESADKAAGENIFNPDIIKKYTDLKEAIELKRNQLNELYKIESVAGSLVAIVNAHKDKELELKARFDEEKESLEKYKAEKRSEWEEEVKEFTRKKKELLESTDKEYAEKKAQLEKQRKREEDDYNYNISREHKKAEDKWNDDIAKQCEEISERVLEVEKREEEIKKLEDEFKMLKDKVDDIPELIEVTKLEGIKTGKADADKSHAFEVRAIKTEYEYKVKALEDKIQLLQNQLDDEMQMNDVLTNKLDAAYAQMRELASETVRSTGGVKILNNNERAVAATK